MFYLVAGGPGESIVTIILFTRTADISGGCITTTGARAISFRGEWNDAERIRAAMVQKQWLVFGRSEPPRGVSGICGRFWFALHRDHGSRRRIRHCASASKGTRT